MPWAPVDGDATKDEQFFRHRVYFLVGDMKKKLMIGIFSPTQTDEWDMCQKHKLMIGICFTNTN
jgi:hypothetical protein